MQALHPAQQPHLVSGFRLDRYELLYPLAQGGMALVWVARQHGMHGFEKIVAIKTILPQYADDPAFQTMFLDEARLASRVRHPNVVEILDLGEQHGTLYLAMEWVDGDAVSRLYNAIARRGAKFPTNAFLRIAADAAAGLHAAHELRDDAGQLLNVVHRDVSPQNLLVSTIGVTKVIDFGVAKARDRLAQETSAGLVKGKVHYSSPEQAAGKTIDRRADLWALGTILYFLFAGRFPYEGESEIATLHLLTSGVPPPALPPEVPSAVAAIIMRALSPRLDDRFPDALAMHAALEAALPEPTTTAHVAALLREYCGDRMQARRRDLAAAVAAAAERSRMHSIPVPLAPLSASHTGRTPGGAPHVPSVPPATFSRQSAYAPVPAASPYIPLPPGVRGERDAKAASAPQAPLAGTWLYPPGVNEPLVPAGAVSARAAHEPVGEGPAPLAMPGAIALPTGPEVSRSMAVPYVAAPHFATNDDLSGVQAGSLAHGGTPSGTSNGLGQNAVGAPAWRAHLSALLPHQWLLLGVFGVAAVSVWLVVFSLVSEPHTTHPQRPNVMAPSQTPGAEGPAQAPMPARPTADDPPPPTDAPPNATAEPSARPTSDARPSPDAPTAAPPAPPAPPSPPSTPPTSNIKSHPAPPKPLPKPKRQDYGF